MEKRDKNPWKMGGKFFSSLNDLLNHHTNKHTSCYSLGVFVINLVHSTNSWISSLVQKVHGCIVNSNKLGEVDDDFDF